jgi:hypothetical protein
VCVRERKTDRQMDRLTETQKKTDRETKRGHGRHRETQTKRDNEREAS